MRLSLSRCLWLAAAAVPLAASAQVGVTSWPTHAGNNQHTNISPVAAQSMREILWSQSIDFGKVYSGSALLVHYASPLVTKNNITILSVKYDPQGVNDGNTSDDLFKFEGRQADSGALVWSENTDYKIPLNPGWYPTCAGTVAPDGSYYYPGAGGTIYRRSSAEAATATVDQIAFYGLATYTADKANFDNNVRICTPLSTDAAGNIYFGFRVYGVNAAGLQSGFAKVTPAGVGSYVSGVALSGNSLSHWPLINSAPVMSNDESVVYVVTRGGGAQGGSGANGFVCSFDAATLAPINRAACTIPTGEAGNAHDSGSSTPTVGPDGDVFFGVWHSNGFRGYMLHWDSTLSTRKPNGAFGWDITPSILPASMVPSYTGTSSYLLMQKYNKYLEGGLGGNNMVAVLDPNDTQLDEYGRTVMKEVHTLLAPTPDPRGGWIEWCVNTTAVDPATKSVIVNSEDGQVYRWDMVTNTLTEAVRLTAGLGEAYTSTIIGPDGLCYAMSDGHVFAIWDGIKPASLSANGTLYSGDSFNVDLSLTGAATGPGATITLSSNDLSVSVPASVQVAAGSSTATIPVTTTASSSDTTVTITASRYGQSTSVTVTLEAAEMTGLSSNDSSLLVPTTSTAGESATGTVSFVGNIPAGGGTVTLSSDSSNVQVPSTVAVGAGAGSVTFPITTQGPLSADGTATITASFNGGTQTTTVNLVRKPSLTSFSFGASSVFEGHAVSAQVGISAPALSGGASVTISATSPIGLPTAAVVAEGATSASISGSVGTTSTTIVRDATATFDGVTLTASLTINPLLPSTLVLNPASVKGGTSSTGTVALNGPAGAGGAVVTLQSLATTVATVPASVTVPAGATSATFTITTLSVKKTATATIRASRNGVSVSSVLTVQKPGGKSGTGKGNSGKR